MIFLILLILPATILAEDVSSDTATALAMDAMIYSSLKIEPLLTILDLLSNRTATVSVTYNGDAVEAV